VWFLFVLLATMLYYDIRWDICLQGGAENIGIDNKICGLLSNRDEVQTFSINQVIILQTRQRRI
jgi:hypothetical protein